MFDMPRPRRAALLAGCACVALAAGPALADVTADDIWAAFQRNAAAAGQGLSHGGESRAGNVLTVRDVVFSAPVEEAGAARLEMGDIVFTEQGDGTVAIALAPAFTLTLTNRPPPGEALDAVFVIRNEGLEIVASGSAEEIAYEYLADALTVAVESFEVDGKTGDVAFDLAARGVEGYYTTTRGDPLSIDSGTAVESVTLDMRIVPPDAAGRLVASLSIENLDLAGRVARLDLMERLETGDFEGAIAEGFAVATDAGYGPLRFSLDFADGAEEVTIESTAASGEGGFELSGERVAYYLSGFDTSYRMTGGDLPVPEAALSFGEFTLSLDLPAAPGTEPRDFSVLARLIDLAIDPALWALADPAATLPRDPATLVVDLVGRLAWPSGLFSPETVMAGDFPGLLDAVQLRELRATVAGAEVTGDGAFIFDNADRETFPGMPRPMGELRLRATGVTGLIDKLATLGALPPDDAQTAKFFLGLFARQVEGRDEYTSTVEITPEGAILANGQALQ